MRPAGTPLDVDELPRAPRLRRVHVGVVAVLLLAGLLWSGWSLLRARPVALATPTPVTVSTAAIPSPGPADPAPGSSAPASAMPSPAGPAPPSASTSGTAAAPAQVVVHVLGAVRSPGLVTLPAGSRVQDAVDAAGGFARRADAGELNLAQVLQDGQQVVIGTTRRPEGEVRGSTGAAAGAGAGPGAGPAGGSGAVVDLNQADAAELEELPGVGPVTAAAILAWRSEHGRFRTVEELQEVDGIGPKTFAQLAPHVRV